MDKWVCNKCGASTEEKPESKNTTCSTCHRGRYRMIKTCACGIEFHPDNAKQKYCSLECKYKYMDKGGKKGKHYPHLQRARIGVCAVCGKEFRAVKDYGEKRQKYCSKECWSNRGKKYKRIPRTPEYRAWKYAVFERDGRKCQMCGSTYRLECHHKKEKINFPELQYDVDNGICLCHECHTKTDNYGYKAKVRRSVKSIQP